MEGQEEVVEKGEDDVAGEDAPEGKALREALRVRRGLLGVLRVGRCGRFRELEGLVVIVVVVVVVGSGVGWQRRVVVTASSTKQRSQFVADATAKIDAASLPDGVEGLLETKPDGHGSHKEEDGADNVGSCVREILEKGHAAKERRIAARRVGEHAS